jgi:hypothetical protein
MDLWCPAQVTQDVLGPMSYYCGLATGGSQSYPIATTATATAAAIATGMGAGTSTETGSSSGAKPGGAATLEPPLSIGAGIIAAFGILAILR